MQISSLKTYFTIKNHIDKKTLLLTVRAAFVSASPSGFLNMHLYGPLSSFELFKMVSMALPEMLSYLCSKWRLFIRDLSPLYHVMSGVGEQVAIHSRTALLPSSVTKSFSGALTSGEPKMIETNNTYQNSDIWKLFRPRV